MPKRIECRVVKVDEKATQCQQVGNAFRVDETRMRTWNIAGAMALALVLCAQTQAGTMLFDFEDDAEVRVWHDEHGPGNLDLPVSRAGRFATSGVHSLCFGPLKWHEGLPPEPAAEGKPGLTDWNGYDRLVWDVANPTPFHLALSVFISDETHRTLNWPPGGGFGHTISLPPMSYQAAEVRIEALKAIGLDPSKIRIMHWRVERIQLRAQSEMRLHVDRIMLLKQGEERPELPASYLQEFAALQEQNVASMRGQIAAARRDADAVPARSPALATWTRGLVDGMAQEVSAFETEVKAGGPKLLQLGEAPGQLRDRLARTVSLAKLGRSFARQQRAVRAKGATRQDVAVGFATSMQKVLPRAGAPELRVSGKTMLALARGETEAFQVVVLPCGEPMKAVSVRVGELRGPGGVALPAKSVTSSVMGYVKTDHVPPNGSPHVGWWPDPILDFMSETDIAAGDAQAFWVSVRAPRDQPAGTYSGKLDVLENGKPLYVFDLSVQVYPFAMPVRSPLNMAVSWRPSYYEPDGQGGWREGPYRDESWKKHKLAWADFLADHYLGYDYLYQNSLDDFDFEMIEYLHKQGRLGRFNLVFWDPVHRSGDGTGTPEEFEGWKAGMRKRIGPAYEKAKALGILDHAYIYGADELPMTWAAGIEQAAAFFKQEFPGTMVLSTCQDRSFGTASIIKSVDAFCPMTYSYKLGVVDQARAQGKQVWWYICCYPHYPLANLFIESAAIEGRLLMGAPTAKFRPGGFLMYQTAIWNSPPITTGPFTAWNPRSWGDFNGDGSWTCLGPDSTPLTTVRLENFRDGVEDYAYALLLEQAVKAVEASASAGRKARWLGKAKGLLAVPDTITRALIDYTQDPAEIYRWRHDMAEAIIKSGVEVALEEK